MDSLTLALPDVSATARLAAMLAEAARSGDVIALRGDLGAGKTELARAFVRRLTDPDEEVPSPTFTLVQVYEAPAFEVWHFDLYRLERPDDALELDIEEAFAEAVSLIEWPERLGPYLPRDRLDLTLTLADPDSGARFAVLTGWPDRLETLARAFVRA